MVKAIFFDLDDTLLWDKKSVQEAFNKTCRLAQEKYEIDVQILEEAVRKEARALYEGYETYSFTQMIGINPFEGLWGEFADDHDSFRKMKEIVPLYRKNAWINGLKAVGIEDELFGAELAEAFPRLRKESPFVYEETFEVLDQLKGKYKLVLITNGSPQLQNTKLEITPEIAPYFDEIIISGAFGRGKPDPSIFEHALAIADVHKEDVLMVGDNLNTDVLGATRAGIKSVWINREEAVPKEVIPTYEIQNLHDLFAIIDSMA
ncbi:HAD family hydrolase [Niallia nealsonii]|uniref:Phosphoserine phosphatase n=1 Tax=Niallia nealsonii TaxID=115979 RepID=A0A2N0Z2Q3_9BACI|nr:HAD family hydrolase [Niallia nealsonii]PKG23782.1 haloacid dehalogenase [Niallia nealsonii]